MPVTLPKEFCRREKRYCKCFNRTRMNMLQRYAFLWNRTKQQLERAIASQSIQLNPKGSSKSVPFIMLGFPAFRLNLNLPDFASLMTNLPICQGESVLVENLQGSFWSLYVYMGIFQSVLKIWIKSDNILG